jgi:hypothetical protein
MTALLLATMLLMRPTAPTPLGRAIEHVESRGNPLAVSPVGARGLWQVMPGPSQRCRSGSCMCRLSVALRVGACSVAGCVGVMATRCAPCAPTPAGTRACVVRVSGTRMLCCGR